MGLDLDNVCTNLVFAIPNIYLKYWSDSEKDEKNRYLTASN